MRNSDDIYTFSELTKKILLDYLNEEYEINEFGDVQELANSLDDILVDFFIKYFIQNSAIYLNATEPSKQYIFDGKNVFAINAVKEYNVKNSVIFNVYPIKSNLSFKTSEITLELEVKSGFINYIAFIIPTKLEPRQTVLKQSAREIFNAGQIWFKKKILKLIKSQESRLSLDLYDFINSKFTNKELTKNLWFGALAKGKGFRVFNHYLAKEAFELISHNKTNRLYSTNQLVIELVTSIIPENKMLMKQIIDYNTCVDVNLSNAQYSDDETKLGTTLLSLYGSDSFTMKPIYKGEKLFVVAIFSTNQKKFINPILDLYEKELKKICKKSYSNIAKITDVLEKSDKGNFFDFLHLKPNLFGIGIDFNKLIKKMKK